MSKQTLAVIVGVIVLSGVGVFGAMAFIGGESNSGGNVHTMQNGSMMTGPMNDETTTGGTHRMDDGSSMGDTEMGP